MTTDTKTRELRASLDMMLTEMGFQLVSGFNDSPCQVWTRASSDMTVKRQGDGVYVETSARPGYPVAMVDQTDLSPWRWPTPTTRTPRTSRASPRTRPAGP